MFAPLLLDALRLAICQKPLIKPPFIYQTIFRRSKIKISPTKTSKAALRIYGPISKFEHFNFFDRDATRKHESNGRLVLIYDSMLSERAPLDEHIESILKMLEATPWRKLVNEQMHIDIFCMFASENGQGSLYLSAAILERITKQGVDLIVDLYPPSCPHCP